MAFCLYRGDFADAAISVAAAAPLAGIIGNAAACACATDLTGEVVGNLTHIENANKICNGSCKLTKAWAQYDQRICANRKGPLFKAATGGYTWAARIVAGSEEAAAPNDSIKSRVRN